MLEEGARLSSMHGADKVYDYSLGNPYAEPPVEVIEPKIQDIIEVVPSKKCPECPECLPQKVRPEYPKEKIESISIKEAVDIHNFFIELI